MTEQLMGQAIFAALYKGVVKATLLLSSYKTMEENEILLLFISKASCHMSKIRSSRSDIPAKTSMSDINISIHELIDKEAIVKDLDKADIKTVADLIKVKDPQILHLMFGLDMEASHEEDSAVRVSKEECRLHEVILAMCPDVTVLRM